jgi:hypothetical protein
MSYRDLDPVNTAHGGYSVGDYVHNTRTELSTANFGAAVGMGGAWVPGVIKNQYAGEPPFLTGKEFAPNDADGLQSLGHVYVQGLSAYPIRPQYSINSAGTSHNGNTNSTEISQSDPIRFGVGSNSISGMNTSWWKTYRVNVDLVTEQID